MSDAPLDLLGRLTAAAVLMRMLDSSKSRVDTALAMSRVEEEIRRREALQQLRPTLAGYQTSPRLFIPAHAPPPEEAEDRYRMGFMANVPVGADAGMVRLASDLGAKLAAQPVIPAAPSAKYQVVRSFFGPVKFKKIPTPAAPAVKAPSSAPAATATPAAAEAANPTPEAGPAFKTKLLGAGIGLGLGGAAVYGATKGVNAAIDYMSEEPGRVQRGMQSAGAPRLAHGLNEYGQPQLAPLPR